MLGGMLAGHDECDGEIRYEERDGEKVAGRHEFYGMSSETAMKSIPAASPIIAPPRARRSRPPIAARSTIRWARSWAGCAR